MCYTDRQYDSRIKKIIELEAIKADLQKQIDAIEQDIKDDMGDNDAVVTKHYAIMWQPIVSHRFDTKAFKAVHEKLYNSFLKVSESRRFTYKKVES